MDCAPSAVADTMQHFYGRDEATFSGTTPGGVTRQFTSFSQLRDHIVEKPGTPAALRILRRRQIEVDQHETVGGQSDVDRL